MGDTKDSSSCPHSCCQGEVDTPAQVLGWGQPPWLLHGDPKGMQWEAELRPGHTACCHPASPRGCEHHISCAAALCCV